MAHMPTEGEDEHFYDMITISPPPLEFGDFSSAPMRESRYSLGQRGHNGGSSEQDFSFLSQNQGFLSRQHSSNANFHSEIGSQPINYDPVMFANPNKSAKVESPDLLSPSSMGPRYPAQNQDFLSPQSVYSDAASNTNSLFHDAASHFSGAAEPPSNLFDSTVPARDTFNQEISLGESISTTNLADMNSTGYGLFEPIVFARDGSVNNHKHYAPELRINESGLQHDSVFLNHQDHWNHDFAKQNQVEAFSTFQNDYEGPANPLTEDNLINYNGKLESHDAHVTISIQQAPELVAAHTPSLFSNSSHNSSPEKKQDYPGNQLQPPRYGARSTSPSLSLNPPSPSASWNGSSSPALSTNLPSPIGSMYSDLEESFLRPEDFTSMRRGRQSAHSLKVRSQSQSKSKSRSGSVSVKAGSELHSDESDAENADTNDDSEAAKSTREKMLELASTASVSKRTQIHPSSYACHLCEKKFTRPYNLKSHLRTHTDDRPFICNICGKAFARQHDRKRHEELHSGEKKYQCRGVLRDGTPFGCGRKFARADALRRHFQTESGRECIKLLVEEDAREQNTDAFTSGIQLPDGEFMNPNAPEVPLLSVSPAE